MPLLLKPEDRGKPVVIVEGQPALPLGRRRELGLTNKQLSREAALVSASAAEPGALFVTAQRHAVAVHRSSSPADAVQLLQPGASAVLRPGDRLYLLPTDDGPRYPFCVVPLSGSGGREAALAAAPEPAGPDAADEATEAANPPLVLVEARQAAAAAAEARAAAAAARGSRRVVFAAAAVQAAPPGQPSSSVQPPPPPPQSQSQPAAKSSCAAASSDDVIDLTGLSDDEDDDASAPPPSKRARQGGRQSSGGGSSRQHSAEAACGGQLTPARGSGSGGPLVRSPRVPGAAAAGDAGLLQMLTLLAETGLELSDAQLALVCQLAPEQLGQLLSRLEIRELQLRLVRQYCEQPRAWHPARPFLHAAQLAVALQRELAAAAAPAPPPRDPATQHTFSVMCLNIWFDPLLAAERMAGVGLEVERLGYPDIVLLQETTPYHRLCLAAQPFWRRYACSPQPLPYGTLLLCRRETVELEAFAPPYPFPNTIMLRDVRSVACRVGATRLRAATTHLESPCFDPRVGRRRLFRRERLQQHEEMMAHLDAVPEPNCLVAGDMNWIAEQGEASPLPDGWADAWLALRGAEPGNTWDPSVCTQKGRKGGSKSRLDRLFFKLADWEPASIQLIADKPIPGVTRTFRTGSTDRSLKVDHPVWPSDHLGLFAVFARAQAAAPAGGASSAAAAAAAGAV